jgi:CBS domain-containing protein
MAHARDEHVRRCTVYQGHGEPCAQSLEIDASELLEVRRHAWLPADRVPLTRIMSRDLICARPDLDVCSVVSLMVRNHVGCIPVLDPRRHPIGVITKFDLIEQLDAFMRSLGTGSPVPADLAARTADEIMMPLALTLDENATIAHAATMMRAEDLHHVLVVSPQGTLVGIVSTKDITNWMVENERVSDEESDTDRDLQPHES